MCDTDGFSCLPDTAFKAQLYDLYWPWMRLSFAYRALTTPSLVFIIEAYALFLYSLLYGTCALTLKYVFGKTPQDDSKSSSSIGDHTVSIYSSNHLWNSTLSPLFLAISKRNCSLLGNPVALSAKANLGENALSGCIFFLKNGQQCCSLARKNET